MCKFSAAAVINMSCSANVVCNERSQLIQSKEWAEGEGERGLAFAVNQETVMCCRTVAL